MNDPMRNWLTRGAIALGVFVVGLAVGWMWRGASSHITVSKLYVYQDWRVACPADNETKRTCAIASDATDPQSGQRIAEVSLGFEEGNLDKRAMVVTVPAGVLLQPGVGLQLGTDTKTYPYQTCLSTTCIAVIKLDDKMMDGIKQAGSINIVVADQRGRAFPLPVSVKGYGDALAAMNSIEAKRHSWWRRLWS